MNYPKEILKRYGNFFEIDFFRPYKTRKGKTISKDVALADVHSPFHNKDIFELVLDDTKNFEDMFIVGDWWDFYSKSFYRKQASIEFPKEFRQGFFLLQRVAERYDNVYLMLSNHDNRFKKWIFDNVPSDLIDFTDYQVIENLIGTIPNVTIVKQQTRSARKIDYVYKHKNVVFTHVEKSNIDITKTVQEIEKSFARWGGYYNLGEYDGVIQAHNHSSGRVKYGDKILMQIPCLIDVDAVAFDYAFNGKIQGNLSALGYCVLHKDKGGYDMRKSYIVDF